MGVLIQTTHSAPILVETLGFSVLFCLDSAENTDVCICPSVQ